jgi:hypothetical protein
VQLSELSRCVTGKIKSVHNHKRRPKMNQRVCQLGLIAVLSTVLTFGFFCNDNPSGPNDPQPPPSSSERPYWGGQVRSLTTFKYGRFEVRMKPQRKSGVISSFFSYKCASADCKKGEEIDVEFVGKEDQQVDLNYHHPTESSQSEHAQRVPLKFDSDGSFATYAFDWMPDHIAWFANGVEIRRIDAVNDPHLYELANEQSIMMNIWTSNYNWGGQLDPSDLPVSVTYDWVKHYPWSPEFGISTMPDWTDDFDDPTLSQWYVSSEETFGESNATFEHGNVEVGNGLLILYLTPKDYANLQVAGACQQVNSISPLGTTLYGKQARGVSGDFDCYSDVYTQHGVRISPWGGAGRAWFDFGPVKVESVTVKFQWVDNAWFDDEKAVEVYNWTSGSWERTATWRGNDGQEHTSSYSISVGPTRIGPQQQVRVALYGAPNSVIHLNTLTVR